MGSIAAFLWGHEPPEAPAPVTMADLHARAVVTEAAEASKALKKRGWRFVGPTTMTALFQAAGIVNDHAEGCVCRAEVTRERAALRRPSRT